MVAKSHLPGSPLTLFLGSLIFNTLLNVVVFAPFGGRELIGRIADTSGDSASAESGSGGSGGREDGGPDGRGGRAGDGVGGRDGGGRDGGEAPARASGATGAGFTAVATGEGRSGSVAVTTLTCTAR